METDASFASFWIVKVFLIFTLNWTLNFMTVLLYEKLYVDVTPIEA